MRADSSNQYRDRKGAYGVALRIPRPSPEPSLLQKQAPLLPPTREKGPGDEGRQPTAAYDLGRPSPRVAMTFRLISLVPAAIVAETVDR